MNATTSQTQDDIPLRFSDGTEGVAVRSGRYAAWLCVCSRKWPLLGQSDADTSSTVSVVRCPDCARKYRVVASAPDEAPTHVQEMPDIKL